LRKVFLATSVFEKILFYNSFVFIHVLRKQIKNIFEIRTFVSFFQKKQAKISAPYAPNPL